MEPRSIVEAGRRFYGSWSATLEAAGIDPSVALIRPRRVKAGSKASPIAGGGSKPSPKPIWNAGTVVAAIRERHDLQKPLNAKAMIREDNPLYRAGRVYFKSWRDALSAAGLCPDQYRLVPRRTPKCARPPRKACRKPDLPCDTIQPRDTGIL